MKLIWLALVVCATTVVALYATGVVDLSPENIVLQLAAWTGGALVIALVYRQKITETSAK